MKFTFILLDYLFDKIEINKIKNKDNIYFKGPFSRLVKKDNSILSPLKELRKLELISEIILL